MKRTVTQLLTLTLVLFLGVTVDLMAQNRGANGNGNAKGNRVAGPAPLKITLPLKEDSVRFVLIGDTGTGSNKQQELADLLLRSRQSFPFEFVLMVGDNLYGGEKPADYRSKFEDVYRPLINQQVKFYAALGNHDEPAQRFYEHFNMEGKEYYRFTKSNVAFYALNSNYMDKKQVDWLQSELAKDRSDWKIAFFHHPPYSSGG
jgi:predicted MPP superfamily phosphohydrolase